MTHFISFGIDSFGSKSSYLVGGGGKTFLKKTATEAKSKKRMPTTLSVPRRSPIQVLTELNAA